MARGGFSTSTPEGCAVSGFLPFIAAEIGPIGSNSLLTGNAFCRCTMRLATIMAKLPGLAKMPERFDCEPVFSPAYAVTPFWMLG